MKINKVKTHLLTSILLLFYSTNIWADNITAEILSYGLYEPGPISLVKINKSAATGYTSSSLGYTHIKTTKTISIIKCSTFGFAYKISGLPNVEVDFIDIEIRHPKMKYHLGGETTYSNAKWEIYPEDGTYESYLVYILRHPYELLPGAWRFNLSYKEKQLLSMDFILEESDHADESIECN